MRPYADNTFYVIGMEKGWFNDVGITIEPAPYGLKTTENQWVSILLNEQVDINTATCSILLPSYKTTDQLKCTGFAVTFFGSVMLANPKLGLKTVRDYAEGGAIFEEALRSGADTSGRQDGLRSRRGLGEGVQRGSVRAGRTRSPGLRHDGRRADAAAREERPSRLHAPWRGADRADAAGCGLDPGLRHRAAVGVRSWRRGLPARVAGVQQRLGLDRRLRQQQPDDDDALCVRGRSASSTS